MDSLHADPDSIALFCGSPGDSTYVDHPREAQTHLAAASQLAAAGASTVPINGAKRHVKADVIEQRLAESRGAK